MRKTGHEAYFICALPCAVFIKQNLTKKILPKSSVEIVSINSLVNKRRKKRKVLEQREMEEVVMDRNEFIG